MAEHKYAQALRWLADGKEVEVRWGSRPEWLPLSNRNEIVNDEIMRGAGGYEFRLKPRTVKIGSREVEAPVLEPVLEPGTPGSVWTWNSDYCRPSEHPDRSCVATEQYALGLCFATEEACRAAHDAIHALLRGEA